ncbi:MAG TPA: hypothetical protein VFV23_04315 [Verrucomicrobiae bacterium]|nr:hypothetical protein [Verrucomicrobiae bacterium]
MFDKFPLTLCDGWRMEAAGPFFYEQHCDTENILAFPPFFSHETDSDTERREDNYLYPLMTYRRYGSEYRWQLCQIINFSGGQNPGDGTAKRFTIFPLYFQQRAPDESLKYTALVPFYGHLENRLFRDDIFFVMFPFYSETRKKDIVTDNYAYPIVHFRHGNGLSGWQVWPIAGHEGKVVTLLTNNWDEVITNGGHDYFFAAWPFYFHHLDGIGTTDPQNTLAAIPFYVKFRSPLRDSTTVLWPFFNWIDDRERKYHEWEMPWPFIVVARGEGKTQTRVMPFFQRAHTDTLTDNFYAWPIYGYKRIQSAPLDRNETRICFYLVRDVNEKNTETGRARKRLDFWPLFVYHRDFNGDSRLQIPALIESFVPNNEGVERDWSPLWSVWRSEKNPAEDESSQSLLWNLWRRDTAEGMKNDSLLFGLFQYHSDAEMTKLRLFYIPVFRHENAKPPDK